jgi:hypothetical protein
MATPTIKTKALCIRNCSVCGTCVRPKQYGQRSSSQPEIAAASLENLRILNKKDAKAA